ncbi:alpha/beta hydrolase [Gaopeijia maritima]|uniref:PET hydrolase/cutinase-like domain-containing protein n=1 Tax=Gaopeijia maritima TaxID=3119007 RepID=A0ABU9E9E0_9BACT
MIARVLLPAPAPPMRRSSRLAITAAAFGLLLGGCRSALRVTPSDADVVLARRTLEAPDPGQPGAYTVGTLFYGSGTDRNRPEYRDSVSIETPSVDASKLVDLGGSARERNDYWGFTPEEFPLNARVWYPEGEGPFPLALVVHGNHDMRDFSDPGYDYLGELLASRGIILASIDMNFINGGIREENDGRGWLLLKHLELWEGFNADPSNPFAGKVDMTRLAVMGHSRGGEAAPVAAAFNRLKRYPDDATLEFDFDFDIRAAVSIAPVDGQYLPTGRPLPIENVDYLVFHGSHDGDVTSFHGLRIWDRLRFTDGEDHFKSAIYMYRANHGQWNSVWNSFDNGPRSPRILDLRYLVPPADQRRFAELYVTAFLEASLKDDRRWLSMFRDHRVVGEWLPESMYITRLQHSSFRALADFEEDVDVTTGSADGVTLMGDSLDTWREETLLLRSSNRANTSASQANQALRLAWNNRLAGADTTRHGPPATFEVTVPAEVVREWGVGEGHAVELSLSATERIPGPRRAPGDDDEDEENDERDGDRGSGERPDPDAPKPPVDLSIQVEDAAGRTASVPLSDYGPIRRPLEIHILRRTDQETRDPTELVLQSYHIPLADFAAIDGALDLAEIRAVRLVFDRAAAGEVLVDGIGFSAMGADFWQARMR